MQIDEATLQDFKEMNMGYCTSCDEITTEGVEPDAENGCCDVCGEQTVFGVENAVIRGFIQIIG